jgi:peptidoglycan glycosyltransferase
VYHYGDLGGATQLTLSAQVQKAALEAMGEYVGTLAVYNYKTGEILCAVSTPNYDPDNVPDIEGDTSGAYEGVYLNRFTQSAYIPGSIYKIVTLAAALETVAGLQDMRFFCEGECMVENSIITCTGRHGSQDIESAFANSCNVAFAEIAQLVGKDNLYHYAKKFGINEAVTFDGITTQTGNLEIADGSALELAWSGIGQGRDQVNACAFMRFVGAIAGGGAGVEPYVVQNVTVAQQQTYAAQVRQSGRIMSQSTAQLLMRYMRNNVQTRYGDEHFPGLTVCAKSGTGEVGGGKKPNATFAGFVMDEEYPLAFIVVIENGGSGSYVCAPVLGPVLQACKQVLDGQ